MVKTATKHDENDTLSLTSSVFQRLQWTFLVGYLLAGAGDNLQGSYRYVLYASYGISRSTIELLYVASYVSALLIGTFAASLADRYGRRLACSLSAFFYILSCFLLNFSSIWILTLGSLFWGIAKAFSHIGFEAWLIQENRERFLDLQLLKRILRNSYIGSALVAIGTGILAQFLVQLSGFTAPFDVAIIFFVLVIIFIWQFWSENYGTKEIKVTTSFITAIRIFRSDPRIVLLGMNAALFDASFYIFVIEWTPTLQRAQSINDNNLLPFGLIFAIFMVFDTIGSFIFYLLAKRIRTQSYMIVVFLLAAVGLMVPVIIPHSLPTIFLGFILFELCAGINYPSMSLLRSSYIPNEVRATMMSYMRVPQIILMLIILVSHFSLSTIFILCVILDLLAMLCMVALRGLKLPEEQVCVGEAQILLDKPLSPSFEIRRPQFLPASPVPQISTKAEDSDESTSMIASEQNHSVSQTP